MLPSGLPFLGDAAGLSEADGAGSPEGSASVLAAFFAGSFLAAAFRLGGIIFCDGRGNQDVSRARLSVGRLGRPSRGLL